MSQEKDTKEKDSKNNSKSNSKGSYLGIMFHCCNVYARIHKNKDGTAYVGRCPRCMRPVKIKIGEGGTNERFFYAD